jgi:anti-sigma regulatory factor (Ser/Thr protein kinase)
MTTSVAIRLRNHPSELAKVRDELDRLGRGYPIPERDLIELQIALDEIVSNVIKYSWSDDIDHEFLVRISLHSDAITLQVIDDGPPFDPRRAPAPTRQSKADQVSRPGGLGIHLITNLVDGFDYQRIRGHNQTTLTKKVATAAVQGKDRS